MHIHFITNTRNGLKIGERNQALGVVDALQGFYKKAIILEHDVSDPGRLEGVMQKYPQKKHVVIGVSDSGTRVFSTVKKPAQHCLFTLIGHEVPHKMQAAIPSVDILAIPKYVKDCPHYIEGVNIVRTDGVSNTMTPDKAWSAYKDWAAKLPVAEGQPVTVVMLGGVVDGQALQPWEAGRLAQYVVEKAKENNSYIIAFDSPRSNPRDTEDFAAVLAGASMGNAFFPFNIKYLNSESPYRAMVGLVAQNPDSKMVVSSDSVSMPCEMSRVLSPQQLFLFAVSNMNQQNREFMDWMHHEGRAGLVRDMGSEFKEEPVHKAGLSAMDAGREIAEAILNLS